MRRILLDENVHHGLRHDLGDAFEVETVQYHGWDSERNGDLLRLAEPAFDVLLTTDRSLPYQQNLGGVDLAVVVVIAGGNRYEDLAPLVGRIKEALSAAEPGTVTRVVV